ncbi:MAG: hypothetical protein QM755_11955 [Luteolibacter sp.]
MVLRSLLVTPWILLAGAAPLSAQNPAPAPAAPAPGENVVKADPVPADLSASAQAAVEKLGLEVVAGRYQTAINRMYPQWKARMAKRAGGMKALDEQLAAVPQILQQGGITLLSSKPYGTPQVFQVAPGKRIEKVDGRDTPVLVYTKWLVIVPTVTRLKVAQDGTTSLGERTSFQAAISDKGKYDWTFIDGSSVNAAELRGLFLTLPETLVLPKVGGREIKEGTK